MFIKIIIQGKFVTATTRRANCTDDFFGKMSIWPSKEAYDKGICEDVITIKNIYLGDEKDYKFFRNTLESFARTLINKKKIKYIGRKEVDANDKN